MKTDILLRAYTKEGMAYLEKVATLIRSKTPLRVQLIDHTSLTLDDFDFEEDSTLISLDKHLSEALHLPYYQISRIFDESGNIVGRHEQGWAHAHGEQVCVLDIDMIQGKTIQMACRKFYTSQYSIPISVGSKEELINIEDLMHPLSLFKPHKDAPLEACSYLLNDRFFNKSTALPIELYPEFRGLFGV